MNFSHIEYILAIQTAGAISKAAQELNLSHPYLSAILKNVEKELGYTLFERGPEGITATPEGTQFIDSGKIILSELEKIRNIGFQNDNEALKISTYYAPFIMRNFLTFCSKRNKCSQDHIREMGNDKVVEAVRFGQSSLGILFFINARAEENIKEIKKDGCNACVLLPPFSLYAVMDKTHPAANKKNMSIFQLFSYPYVSYDDESSKAFLQIIGINSHNNVLEVSDRGSFNDAIDSGNYLSTTAFGQKPQSGQRVYIPLTGDDFKICSYYITAKSHQLTSREKNFIHFLR